MKTSARCALVLVACGALVATAAFASGPDPDRYIVKFNDARAGKAAVAQAGGGPSWTSRRSRQPQPSFRREPSKRSRTAPWWNTSSRTIPAT